MTAAEIQDVVEAGEMALPSDAVVTDLAQEVAARRGIRIRFESKNAEAEKSPDKRSGTEAKSEGRLVALAADHAGYELKEALKSFLLEVGYTPRDLGTDSDAPVDYPDFASAVARGEAWRGIIIDSAGIGSAIAANKVPGVRAASCYDRASARTSREHNDANLLALGARMLRPEEAREIVAVWLGTAFVGGRHSRRIEKITALENEACDKEAGGQAGGSERLIEQITQEVLKALASQGLCALGASQSGEEEPCPHCDGRCIESCAQKTREIISAGADRLGAALGISQAPAGVARFIDHTLLRPEATRTEILKLCEEAKRFGFASVCINPSYVPLAVRALGGSIVKVCAVAGFPFGATLTAVKVYEADQAMLLGAQEIDMVINVGALKSRENARVEQDIRSVVETCHRGGALVKVILECALLTDEEKVRGCCLAQAAGADFVKTSTGFGPGGATARDVELMRLAVGARMGVKAAGGIRSYADLEKMLKAGATRIGASASVKILEQAAGTALPGAEPQQGSEARY